LIRPGLERVRDLAAEGELDAVLVYAPDRLSRRYAYQILLIEELARCSVCDKPRRNRRRGVCPFAR
jgi:site-specific DNA recombinase